VLAGCAAILIVAAFAGCGSLVPITADVQPLGSTRFADDSNDRPVPIYTPSPIDGPSPISEKYSGKVGQPLLPSAEAPPNTSIGLIKIYTETFYEGKFPIKKTFKRAQAEARKLGADAIILSGKGTFKRRVWRTYYITPTLISHRWVEEPAGFVWTFKAVRFNKAKQILPSTESKQIEPTTDIDAVLKRLKERRQAE
jgi:hypothetical protein